MDLSAKPTGTGVLSSSLNGAATASPSTSPVAAPASGAPGLGDFLGLGNEFKNFNPNVAPNNPSPVGVYAPAKSVISDNGVVPPSNVGSVGFGVTPTNSVDSSHLTGATQADALTAYDQYIQDVQNGKFKDANGNAYDPSATQPNGPSSFGGPTPTDKYMNQIFQQSSYTPEEIQALNQYSDVTNRINQATLSERRQIQALHENGAISTEQAAAMSQESQRRSDAQLADLAVQQQGASLSLGVLGQLRGNNLQALQNLSPFYAPTQVSPGSTLANAQGENFFQGNGASPQTIIQTAQQLEQSAQQQGTLQYNADGSVNHQAYIQQAQQYYGTGALGGAGGTLGGGGGSLGSSSGGGVQSQLPNFQPQPNGSYMSPRGFTINSGEAAKVAQLPAQFQSYVDGGPLGVAYINADRVPQTQAAAVQTYAKNAGIPFLTGNEVAGVQAVDSIFQNLQLMKQFAAVGLGTGLTGRLEGLTTNQIQGFFGSGRMVTDPATGKQVPIGVLLKNFDQFRDNAGKAVTALAGGVGSGFRMSAPVIEQAVNNLPTSRDNAEQANAKVDDFARLVMNQFQTNFPSVKGVDPLNQSGSVASPTAGGNTTVNTAVGVINTNW